MDFDTLSKSQGYASDFVFDRYQHSDLVKLIAINGLVVDSLSAIIEATLKEEVESKRLKDVT